MQLGDPRRCPVGEEPLALAQEVPVDLLLDVLAGQVPALEEHGREALQGGECVLGGQRRVGRHVEALRGPHRAAVRHRQRLAERRDAVHRGAARQRVVRVVLDDHHALGDLDRHRTAQAEVVHDDQDVAGGERDVAQVGSGLEGRVAVAGHLDPQIGERRHDLFAVVAGHPHAAPTQFGSSPERQAPERLARASPQRVRMRVPGIARRAPFVQVVQVRAVLPAFGRNRFAIFGHRHASKASSHFGLDHRPIDGPKWPGLRCDHVGEEPSRPRQPGSVRLSVPGRDERRAELAQRWLRRVACD